MASGKRKRKLLERQEQDIFKDVEDIDLQQVTSAEDIARLRKQKRSNQSQYIIHNGMMIELD